MHFKKLDLNLLVALDSLLKEKSVTKTADNLMLSPSTISSSLSRLREYFDDELLTKVGRKMEITPLGESLRDPVRDILNRIDNTILLQPVFEPHNTNRTFSFFISDYTQMVLFPHLLALADEEQSTAQFNLLRQIDRPYKALERGEADLLVIPEEFISPDNPHDHLFTEDFVCLMWEQNKYAETEMTQEIYLSAKHVMMQLADNRKDHIEMELSKRHNITRKLAVSTYSLSSVPGLLVGTNFIATVHSRVAKKMQAVLPLVTKPVPYEISPMKQTLQWHHYRSKDPGLIWLRDLIQRAIIRMNEELEISD